MADRPSGIRPTGYGLRATGYGLRATGYGLRARTPGQKSKWQYGAVPLGMWRNLLSEFRPTRATGYICRTGFDLKDEQVHLWKRGGALDGTAYPVSNENGKDTVVLPISDTDLALDPHLILHFVKDSPTPSGTSITS